MPVPRKHKARKSDRWERMAVGDSELHDVPTARCLYAFIRNRGWTAVQKQEGKKVRVWRAA